MQVEAPQTLLIVGAGAIGMEFADVYGSFGTEVTVIEALDRILPLEDAEVSQLMERIYSKRGMEIHTRAHFQNAEIGSNSVEVTFTDKKGDVCYFSETTVGDDGVRSCPGTTVGGEA